MGNEAERLWGVWSLGLEVWLRHSIAGHSGAVVFASQAEAGGVASSLGHGFVAKPFPAPASVNHELPPRPQSRHFGATEIRFAQDESIDEIVVYLPSGKTAFHLEYMDDNHIWASAYDGDRDLPMDFTARGKIKARLAD